VGDGVGKVSILDQMDYFKLNHHDLVQLSKGFMFRVLGGRRTGSTELCRN